MENNRDAAGIPLTRPGSGANPARHAAPARQRVARSYATADTGLANKLFDDSLFVTSGNGRIKDKKGEMADVGPLPPGFEIHYFRTSDVRVQPRAGVVTGLAEWSWTWNGRTAVTRRRYTAVYVRGGPLGWRMMALHIEIGRASCRERV